MQLLFLFVVVVLAMFYYVTDGDGVHVMCICHFCQHYLPVVFASCDILVMKYLNDKTKIKIKRGKRRSASMAHYKSIINYNLKTN